MKFKSLFLTASLAVSLLVSATSAMAAGYMPFILGSSSGDSVSVVVDKTKQALTENGFEVVGSYKPNADSEVIVVTNDALKNLAGLSKNGGFGAMERVSVVKRGNQTEVSYTNPTYMWNVYRMDGDIQPVQAAMEKALGNQKGFGADKPLTAEELREYHYKFMMPYFDDVDEIQEFDSYQEGVNTIEAGLKAGRGGVTQVYRIDIPGKDMTVFGVAFSKTEGADKNILTQIDGEGHSHAAHLPYELLVNGNEALALNGKFRIAINWPSLSMMGSGSFMSIANAPDEIKQSLEIVAGNE
ncbi:MULTISPECIES: hypothetical protein [Piscirickettsiaceae]|jgi:hypothetical protein|uniref:Uncharacterized protein n=1 Tax=Hydrogenovibrio thermophilus TaxID=265883 RepID=A0A410H473_9GAMM|nr:MULTISPECIES: hypothetical protein [Piscirickettsiaceae]AZR81755.1 hypothetical protein AYJ59_05305 [Thiomicrospira sp. S5]QAB15723.1 hypothetical protein EPV75_08615 [Hydrogenovibrio thermophilus]